MNQRYTQSEIDYIAEHYPLDGPSAVAYELKRPAGSIRFKARQLGLSYTNTRDILAAERKKTAELRKKADTCINENADDLQEIMRTRREMDDGKVSVQFDSRTIILMDASKATPEHIARLRERMGKALRV